MIVVFADRYSLRIYFEMLINYENDY